MEMLCYFVIVFLEYVLGFSVVFEEYCWIEYWGFVGVV